MEGIIINDCQLTQTYRLYDKLIKIKALNYTSQAIETLTAEDGLRTTDGDFGLPIWTMILGILTLKYGLWGLN